MEHSKRQVVDLVVSSGRTPTAVASEVGLHPTLLCRWVRQQGADAGKAEAPRPTAANPLDNAPMESFFHTMKTELVHHRTYTTRNESKRDLFAYVEGFYNHQRFQSALDYRTPNQAEQQAENVA